MDGMDFVSSLPHSLVRMTRLKISHPISEGKADTLREIRGPYYVRSFCGGGGLSLEIGEALSTSGFQPKPLVAVDTDNQALKLTDANFRPM